MGVISNRIREAMRLRGVKQAEIVEKTGIGKSSISTYLTGEYEPKQRNLYLIAQALDVNPAWLMGLEVPMDAVDIPDPNEGWRSTILNIKRKRVRLLGDIAAGEPIFADEDYETYVYANDDIDCDFALRACGDSMINARINDGDLVFIREQPTVDDGEIAAVIIDDCATLKRVYKINGGLMLVSENPKYKPMRFTHKNSDCLRILGKAIAFQSEL